MSFGCIYSSRNLLDWSDASKKLDCFLILNDHSSRRSTSCVNALLSVLEIVDVPASDLHPSNAYQDVKPICSLAA